MRWKLSRMQQTVTQSFSSTLRSSSSRVLTTCSCARPGDRPVGNDHDQNKQKVLHSMSRIYLMRKITFHKLRKKAASATTISVEADRCHGILDELAQRLGDFQESARALASCLQKHDVSRKTDQSMIEAARCMFHKLLEEVRDDLDRLTPRQREGLCTEIKQSKQRRSHTVILKENPCPRPEEPSEKSVHQTSTETPLSQSSAEIPEQVIEDDPRKQLEFSVPQYERGESIADSDLEDEQLRKMLASPLYIQEREGDFDSSRKPRASGTLDAMVVQKRETSAQRTHADHSRRESLRSSSSREPRVSGLPDAMFPFDSEPTLNTFSVRNRSNEPGDQFESSVHSVVRFANKDQLLHQAMSELMKQEHRLGSLTSCINKLQQQTSAQRLELQDAHHGYIESRREQS